MAIGRTMLAQLCVIAVVFLSLTDFSDQAPVWRNYGTYSESLGRTMMRYSTVAYRSAASLATWSCYQCRHLKSFILRRVVLDPTHQGRFIIGYDSSLRSIIIAFRGSAKTENWIRNLDFWPVKTDLFTRQLSAGRVHSGFYKTYSKIRPSLISELQYMVSKSAYANAHIFVTGHSLGGALATLCALDFSARYPNKTFTMYNFGSPRVGNGEFVEAYKKKVSASFRVVNTFDPVTSLPYKWLTYRHVPEEKKASSSSSHLNYLGVGLKDGSSGGKVDIFG